MLTETSDTLTQPATRRTSQMAARSRRSSKRSRPATPLLETAPRDSSPDPDLVMLEQSDPALVYLAELIGSGKKIVFITGAGISRGSGIATYRGALPQWPPSITHCPRQPPTPRRWSATRN